MYRAAAAEEEGLVMAEGEKADATGALAPASSKMRELLIFIVAINKKCVNTETEMRNMNYDYVIIIIIALEKNMKQEVRFKYVLLTYVSSNSRASLGQQIVPPSLGTLALH